MTWVSFKPLLTSNLRHNIKKIVRAHFEIKMKKSIFRLFLGFFPKNQPNEIFFEKSGSVTFEPLWTTNSMHNIKKILRANSEKKRYWHTDWLTDWPGQFHRSLPLRGGPKSAKVKTLYCAQLICSVPCITRLERYTRNSAGCHKMKLPVRTGSRRNCENHPNIIDCNSKQGPPRPDDIESHWRTTRKSSQNSSKDVGRDRQVLTLSGLG